MSGSDDDVPDPEFTMAVEHHEHLGDESEDGLGPDSQHLRPGQSGVRRHWKTISAAFCLLVVGFTFIIVAFADFGNGNTTRGIAFFVVGLLCAVPGGFQCYVLYQAWRRTPGYSFHQIPSFKD
jgi:Transmembrane proteins 230/134